MSVGRASTPSWKVSRILTQKNPLSTAQISMALSPCPGLPLDPALKPLEIGNQAIQGRAKRIDV